MILPPFITVLTGILLLPRAAESALHTAPSQLSRTEYDFVIVGAGTAGNVLANRLSEESSFTVLVVEAGIPNSAVVADEVPYLASTLFPNTPLTWNYTTASQSGLNGREITYPRGRALGGSSTINLQAWTRASRDDWDRFANFTGDSGWSWDEIFPYMIKSESLVQPPDHHNTSGAIVPSLHGTTGPVQISLGGFPMETDQRVLNTTQELPEEFPFNEDMNSGSPLGIGWLPFSVDTQGKRSSSATAYLQPIISRPNVDVLVMTQVTQIIASGTVNGLPHFDAIQVAQSRTSSRMQIMAKKEVILSAGAVNSPLLLQLSGIGNPATLRAVGIKPIVELNDVGQNLADHPFLTVQWSVDSTAETTDLIARNATLANQLLQEWETTGTGRYCDPGSNQVAWLKAGGDTQDASAGPTAAQIELMFFDGFVSLVQGIPATGDFFTVGVAVSSPFSRGSITLASNDPFDSPVIDPGLLSDSRDMSVMVQAVKMAMQMLQASTWDGYILKPATELSPTSSDAEIANFARNFTSTEFHPAGSLRMAPSSSQEGVVNPNLQVKGASGLRVVDASVFPFIPAGHLQACVYAVAERAGDLIKQDWL
ncbi:aryl-alcohol oxidase-like protein [Obba rivulosa]|uniref:Aryl-alcohol oxidase-like protein n=1 Tax=Obba rivulosa TaxID=1052685 RepID=A0A8E2ANP5_9APHY|nr:aryl-alcohol oxidase-like protein [Obba rivulosa]